MQCYRSHYDLVWNARTFHKIHDTHSLLPHTQGGVGCQDLTSIVDASAVAALARMIDMPALPWVQLLHKALISVPTRAAGLITEVLTRPWFQNLGSRGCNEKDLPRCALLILPVWQKLFANPTSPVKCVSPRTRSQVEAICFWYHPAIAVKRGVGVQRFSTQGFRLLATSGAWSLGDIWDADLRQPILPADTPQKLQRSLRESIEALVRDLPDAWTVLLHTNPGPLPPTPFQEVGMALGADPNRLMPIHQVSFRRAYKALLAWKLDGVDFSHRIQPICDPAQLHLRRTVTTDSVWSAARGQFIHPKTGDLLWHLLHDKVLVGLTLSWLPAEQQACPACHVPSSVEHLWIHCPQARQLWRVVLQIWHTTLTAGPGNTTIICPEGLTVRPCPPFPLEPSSWRGLPSPPSGRLKGLRVGGPCYILQPCGPSGSHI